MRFLLPVAILTIFLSLEDSSAFVARPPALSTTASVSSSSSFLTATAMDAEELLRRAAKLKAEAQAAETQLHQNLMEKKQSKDQELDGFIDKLFPPSDTSMEGLMDRLKKCHWSTDRLLQIVKRLHEREIVAQGKGLVAASQFDVGTMTAPTTATSTTQGHGFVARKPNPAELARVQGLIDRLMEAAELIDEEYMSIKRQQKEQQYLTHVELDHWTKGELAGHLRRQVGELRREHEEQFQERLESFYEAQRKNKKNPPANNDKNTKKP